MRMSKWAGPAIVLVAFIAAACGNDHEVKLAPSPSAPAEVPFDQEVAAQLQGALETAVDDPATSFPGVILYASSPRLGTWAGAAGLGDVESGTPMHVGDRFRAGSIAKVFVSTVVLELVEEGQLSLDDRLPDVLPEAVVVRFPDAGEITVRMLLNHSSGIPEWLTPAVVGQIGADPAKVWDVKEFLDLAAAQPPAFAPGTSYQYSNTDYNLLGLVIENATGHSWRDEVTARVIKPLGLEDTLLPEPGDTSIPGDYAHGYASVAGTTVDITGVDPSMAGAAGGGALVTTAPDLARFLSAVLAGELFDRPETLDEMLTFIDAPDQGGQVGYGLGMSKYSVPGDIEIIGHLGMTAGYTAFTGYLPAYDLNIVAAMNQQDDPSPVLLPAIQVLVAAASR